MTYFILITLPLAFITLLLVNRIEKRKHQNAMADFFRLVSLEKLIFFVLFIIVLVAVLYSVFIG